MVQNGWLAGKQLTQEKLVMMLTEITKAQLLCLRLGRLKDEGVLHHTMVSMAKRNNVNVALEIARSARILWLCYPNAPTGALAPASFDLIRGVAAK